jgi:histone-lysine N-methyltransferase SETMAR
MTKVRDFVAGLARSGKSAAEIKTIVDAAYGDKALGLTSIYYILKKVKEGKSTDDQRHLNAKKTKRTAAIVAAVAADVAVDRRVSCKDLAFAYGLSIGTVFNILRDDLGLVKKSARWVPKLLSDQQKEERVRTCEAFVAAVQRRSLSMLDEIVTMDETMVSFHTPETKKQSKQWIEKGKPGPIKARVHASRTKQMVMAFFDSRGLIYSHIVPKGAKINATYIVKVLGIFLKKFRQKRPEMAARQWFFHWDNAPVHTAAVVQAWIAANNVQVLEHPPYSPDLAPADFFLFRRVKEELAGKRLTPETLKKTWDGVTRSIGVDEFAAAFRRWLDRCNKCIRLNGGYVEKS